MNWNVVGSSVVGTSHTVNGKKCEDSCWAQVVASLEGKQYLSLFVADGAGSALKGGEGAEAAIQTAVNVLQENINKPNYCLNEDSAVQIINAIRKQLVDLSEKNNLQMRDYACTFLGLISCSAGTLVFQIGDGGIVVDVGAGLHVSITPMSGEYANMTYFITDENAQAHVVCKSYPTIALRAAAFSDGLQRLALNFSNNTVHEPFFSPLFRVLSTTSALQETQLHAALVKFLQSDAVNSRTDDDKTLTMAYLLPQ